MDIRAAKLAAEAKRQRKAAKRTPTVVAATNSPGAEFARAGIRRMDRAERAKAFDHGSAEAARLRRKNDAERGRATAAGKVVTLARKLSPTVLDLRRRLETALAGTVSNPKAFYRANLRGEKAFRDRAKGLGQSTNEIGRAIERLDHLKGGEVRS